MNFIKVLCFVRNHQLISPSKRPFFGSQIKSFSLTPKLCKQTNNSLSELEERFKKLFNEYKDQSSPIKPLLDRWMSKPWIAMFGEMSKNIPIKERKESNSLKEGMFRMAFDLTGFKAEDIHIIASNSKLYIEAKKEETTKDGSKAWREFSFECNLDSNVNPKSITAQLDLEGLLVVDGEVPKESLSGVKKGGKH